MDSVFPAPSWPFPHPSTFHKIIFYVSIPVEERFFQDAYAHFVAL